MTKPVVSLCLIVRNEAARIGDCLASVRGFAQEIVVVDTGSEDGTEAIAEQLGAKVYRCRWNEHFAEARNESLKRATGDWALVLDADESIDAWDEAELQRLLADPEAGGYALTVRNYRSAAADDYESDTVVRLFRRLPGIAYTGRIHEEIVSSLKRHYPHLPVKTAPFIVRHTGYAEGETLAAAKAARNRRLLERAIREEDDKLYYRYAWGAESFLHERYGEAARELAPLLRAVPPSAGYASDLACKLAYALWRSGNPEAALQTAETGLVREPEDGDLRELYVSLLLEEGHWETALRRLSATGGWRLGFVHSRLLNAAEALRSWERCLRSGGKERERALPFWLEWAFACYGDNELALRLEEVLEEGPAYRETLAQLCRHAMKWRRGHLLLPRLAVSGEAGNERELAFHRAVFCAQSGDTDAAQATLHQLRRTGSERFAAIYDWALACRENGDDAAGRLVHLLGEWPEPAVVRQAAFALLAMGAWSAFGAFWREEAAAEIVPAAWRPAIVQAPQEVRRAVYARLGGAAAGERSFGERVLAALLAASLGDGTASATAFARLREQFPRRLEPIAGQHAALSGSFSGEWGPLLLAATS
ncbi:glycosyltransferase family 2 protein [Paenibacillus cymbidii]|uniref:glycosyltransferase family 2 protein n=1 Tax=Paenibacillus cymbidii TaxID=1639034 RepID=UPI001436B957|nr:glycosyltransferase family 2 protein [Paenibacillus cymbidii]